MGKKLLIDATHAEETRVVVLDGNKVEDFDFETVHKRQLAGNIYLAKVTRVEPSLQAAFVDYGGNRHGFLAFAEIHPDYYQIPVADRQALLAEERALARDSDEDEPRGRRRGNGGGARQLAPAELTGEGDSAQADDAALAPDAPAAETPVSQTPVAESAPAAEAAGLAPSRTASGMDIVDLGDDPEAMAPSLAPATESGTESEPRNGDEPEPYSAADHASEVDDQIESVAEEDISDEVRPVRRPRARRYKIQEVIKVRQIMLVQVIKEERGNKGAALTTYLSLAGRYCVLMPNTGRGGGISRKITNPADRKKLKDIAGEMEVPEGAGLIIRTAGANRTKQEIRRDYEYLFRLWEQIRDLTLKSIAPAPIYEEGDLIKRSIRDLYNKDIDEVLVEGDAGHRAARDFMRMILPGEERRVKLHAEPMPLFARYQVEGYLAGMFNPTVQLKSGGYIVIGVTEALVAIDINSGKATRQGSIEETALQTNLEAADEIARQLRLRDLAGLIVIDFIDMEERKHNAAVEKRLKDALRNDRARIQVGRISGFGLLEMSRQRLRPGMLEATTQPCPHCHGTGLIRSDNSIALAILRALEEEGVRRRSREVLLRAPVGVVNYLFNEKREHLAQIETRYGLSIRLEGDATLISPDYSLEKFKTATRQVRALTPVVSLDAQTMSGVDEDLADRHEPEPEVEAAEAAPAEAPEAPAAASPAPANGESDAARRKRRRRRRRRPGEGPAGTESRPGTEGELDSDEGDETEGDEAASDAAETPEPAGTEAEAPAEAEVEAATSDTVAADTAEVAAEATAKPARKRRSRSKAATGDGEVTATAEEAAEPAAAPRRRRTRAADRVAEPAPATEPAVEPPTTAPAAEPEVAPPAPEPEVAPPAAVEPDPPRPDAAAEAPEPQPDAVAEAPDTQPEPRPDAAAEAPEAQPAPQPDAAAEAPEAQPAAAAAEPAAPDPGPEPAPDRPRRAGWWSRRG